MGITLEEEASPRKRERTYNFIKELTLLKKKKKTQEDTSPMRAKLWSVLFCPMVDTQQAIETNG